MKINQIRVTEILVMDKADLVTRQDGALMANPRVGRIGIQLYQGKELGRPDMAVVRVYRPESEVMDKRAMASLTHRPVTNDHPPEPVTADNWKKYAVGNTGDTVARDGEFIRVPMMLSDGAAIRDVNDGKKELSLGYTSNLEWRQGATPQGEAYDAVQTEIRINHLAVVDAARGGPKLAIGDSISVYEPAVISARKLIADGCFDRKASMTIKPGDVALLLATVNGVEKYPFAKDGKVYRSALESIKAQAATSQEASIVALADELLQLIDTSKEKSKMDTAVKAHVIDGITVEMNDIAASVVMRRIKNLETEAGDLHSKLATALAKSKDAEKTTEEEALKAKKKMEEDAATITTLKAQLDSAKLTPAKLDELVKDRSVVVGKARAVLGDKLVVDGKTGGEMRRQVVDAKLGDSCKGWTDDQVNASFATLTADVKITPVSAADHMRTSFSGAPPVPISDADREARYSKYNNDISNRWKGDQKTA